MERIELKATSIDDAEFLFELMNTPKWLKFIGYRNVDSVSDAKAYIQKNYVTQQERLGFSTYTVILKADHTKLGVVGLYNREGVDGIDLGFAFLEQFEGKGYAYEAAQLLIDKAFQEFELTALKAITDENNLGSQKLLEKLGFKRIRKTRLPNAESDVLLYELSA
jgi:[ribosomal protein S5]-alanine N-acetyltransferase